MEGDSRTIPEWPRDPAGLEPAGVDFGALGHVLGNTCCWGGRTRRFYSLAQHAVTVCTAAQALGGLGEADGRRLALHALLANAWRAWLPEEAAAGAPVKALEKHARERAAVQQAVLEAAGVSEALPESWAQALGLTQRMAEAAVRRDFADAGIGPGPDDGGPSFPPAKERIRPMRPEVAAKRWIETLEGLRAPEPRAPAPRVPAPGGGT